MKIFLLSFYSFVPDYYFLNVSFSFFKVLPKYHVKISGPLAIPPVEHTI